MEAWPVHAQSASGEVMSRRETMAYRPEVERNLYSSSMRVF